MKLYVSNLLFFVTIILFANSADNSLENPLFIEKNKKTAWSLLEKAISFADAQPLVNETKEMDLESLSFYVKTYEKSINNLYDATKMPDVDFSCYNNATPPKIIAFTSKIPNCIRLLMLNYQYGVRANKPDIEYSSLLAALQTDSLLNGNPYIYYQLIRAANIDIIFQTIKNCSEESSFDKLSVQEIDNLISIIQKKKIEIKTAWAYALKFESLLDDKILLKTLPFHEREKLADKKIGFVIAGYKSALGSMAKQIIKEPSDKGSLSELKKQELDINKHFSNSILDFERWFQVCSYSELQLDAIEMLLQAVIFYKKNGIFPTSNDVFPPKNTDAIKYFPQKKGFDLIIKNKDVLSYGYIKKTSNENKSLRNLFSN